MSEQNKSASGSITDGVSHSEMPTHGSRPMDGTAAPSKSTMITVELTAGSTLGPYRIEKKLGEGGMGAVYKATHEHLEKSFAVKVLPTALTQNPDAVARFLREMKPSNLLVGKDGQIKLLDLGLARLSLDPAMTTELTTEGQTFGTPDYMAPEPWQDAHNADSRADLYSLGCTLFYLLAGRAPFGTEQFKTMASKMTAHITGTMPELATNRADVPAELCAIYQKLTAKKPADRYQSAADVVTALAPFTKTRTVGEPGGVSPRTYPCAQLSGG